jgi:hypothetical protein
MQGVGGGGKNGDFEMLKRGKAKRRRIREAEVWITGTLTRILN